MLRIPHYVIFAAGAALLAQPALASEQQHRRHAATIKQEVAASSYYDAFGGYADAAAAASFTGPNARRYFTSAPDRHAGVAPDRRAEFASLVEAQASANGVPASLVHRVIMRESRYNPRAVSAGNYGLMQIRLGTARAMGYTGSAEGLLDAETNMTYAVKYLAGAYHAAGGNEARAVALYASGYGARPVQQASFVTQARETSFATPAAPAAAPHANASGRHLRHHRV
jgi:soluble lytic murein transglycosylase-like protein